MTAPKTIRVRIAVAVTEKGEEWDAAGYHNCTDAELVDLVRENIDVRNPHHIVWVTADVPLPTQQTVEGEVEA